MQGFGWLGSPWCFHVHLGDPPLTVRIARTAIFTISISMTTRNKNVAKIATKRSRGRPRKADAKTSTVPVALSKDLIAELDEWCAREGVKHRSTAIRRFIEQGLRGKR